MIQPGMSFGSEGPVIQGTWVNPTSGDSFTVRDSFFEDNQYIVTTTDGRYIRYDQLQNYIQADPKSIDGIKQAAASRVKEDEPLPAEISSLIDTDDTDTSMITPEDAALIYGSNNSTKVSLGNLYSTPQQVVKTPKTVENMNEAIIKKALNNTEQPKFKINVDWNNFPTKQIEMLYDIMGISEDEIIEWYLDNIQMIDIIDTIKESIKERIRSTKNIIETIVCDTPEIKNIVCTDVIEETVKPEPITDIKKVTANKKKTTKNKK